MIVGDAPLEAALRKKRVHMDDIRSVVVQQLMMVEARQGPWNQALLLRGMARLESMPIPPRPEESATTTPASAPRARAIGYIPMPAGAVVLHSPGSGTSQNPSMEIPAGSLRLDNPIPGLQQEIGRCLLHIPCTVRDRAERGRSDHGECNHRRRIHGSKAAPDGP